MKNRQAFQKLETQARAAAIRHGIDGDVAVRAFYDTENIVHNIIDTAIAVAADRNIADQTILNALIQKSMNRLFRIDAHASIDPLQAIVGLYRAKANGAPTDSGPEWEAFMAAGVRLKDLATAKAGGDAA